MAKQIANYPSWAVFGGTLADGEAANWVQGVIVGYDSDGKLAPSDFRVSTGPIVGLGAALQNAQQKDAKNNVVNTITQVSGTKQCKISGLTGLTAGATYYLSSGGGITATAPAVSSGDINQVVGVASSTTELELLIGSPIVLEV